MIQKLSVVFETTVIEIKKGYIHLDMIPCEREREMENKPLTVKRFKKELGEGGLPKLL